MPPTFKDSSAVFSSPSEDAARAAGRVAGGAELSNPQPVALEVPVTVNAARAVEGSEKREPFSEKTSTVLVFANGAVIRLMSMVAPGQLLFLINEKTRKEVVCQVVQSKNDRNVSGYVELEFTQPALGFWGMRFPGERSALPSGAALDPAAQAPHTLAAGPKGDAANPAAHVSVKSADRNPGSGLEATVESDSDFKTEIKADSRPLSKADLLAPAETSTEPLKLETNRLQEQLSALLFAEQKASESQPTVAAPTKQEPGDAATKIIEMAESEDRPAPKSEASPAKIEVASPVLASPRSTPAPVKSSFDDEEVKIPAWLEPLARNAAIPAPPESEETAPHLEERHTKEANETPLAAKASTASSKRPPAPALVGKTLFGENAAAAARQHRSGKGIWIGIAASLLVAAAGGAWYFRDSLLPAHGAVVSNTAPIGVPAAALPSAPPATASPVSQQAPLQSATPETTPSSSKASAADPAAKESASPLSPGVQGKMQTAAISERIPKSDSNPDALKTSAKTVVPEESVEPEVTRPSLGKVRLAKPKVGRTAKEQVSGEMEPALEAGNDALSSGEPSLSSGLIAGSANQPAAPLPVSGEVKSARMISSVAPAYPALARTQHISGDVRIDALIDETGRVTTMKVVAGPTLLQQAAMDALRQWKYQPATLGGKAVPMHLTVTIQFRLQ